MSDITGSVGQGCLKLYIVYGQGCLKSYMARVALSYIVYGHGCLKLYIVYG